jgi:DNA-binding response OmpR family regulator
VEQVQACSPDLVILDHDLTGFSVRRLCAKIKTANGHPPPGIILLTESPEVASLERVRALGADERLYRPLRVDAVEKRVQEVIEALGVSREGSRVRREG